MDEINRKLDKILQTLENMNERMNIIEGKIAANADKPKETDVRLTSRCDCLKNELTKTAKLNNVEDFQEQLNNAEELINTNANSVKDINSRFEQLRYKICAF